MDANSYALFLATVVVLVVSPGPDTALVLTRTVASGRMAGLLTVIGTQIGNMIHALLAGLGISTLITLFPLAFDGLRYIGVAYLLYLAWSTWRAAGEPDDRAEAAPARRSAWRYIGDGLVNNLANAKMIPFFVALFPQFVRPENGAVGLQSLVLGLTLAGMATAWLGMLVVVIGRARNALTANALFLKVARRLAAATFVGLACKLATERQGG
jgi:threonine/homoserine/homoserine lactone efflux protein